MSPGAEKDEAVKELDLTQRLPVISVARPWAASTSGRQTRTFALLDARGFSDAATLGDLLACIAALPAETQTAIASKIVLGLPRSQVEAMASLPFALLRAEQAEARVRALEAEAAKLIVSGGVPVCINCGRPKWSRCSVCEPERR